MTLNQSSPQINPDHVTDYLYDNASVDAAGFIIVPALLAQLRDDFGDVDYFTPDNNPNSPFCIAIYQRACQHNSARLEQVVAEADPIADKAENEPVDQPRNWLLPVTCLFALLIVANGMSSLLVAVAALVG